MPLSPVDLSQYSATQIKAATAPATTYDDSWLSSEMECRPHRRIKVYLVVAGTAPTSIEAKIETSNDEGTTWFQEHVQLANSGSGTVSNKPGEHQFLAADYSGAIQGELRYEPDGVAVARVQVKRTGGDGTTTVQAWATGDFDRKERLA